MSRSNQNSIAKYAGNNVRYFAVFAHVFGSAKTALMLSQLLYWNDMGHRHDGFFFKTVQEFYYETGLTEDEQITAVKKLREKYGVIYTKVAGTPAKRHFLVDVVKIQKMVTRYLETADKDLVKALFQFPEKQRTITETTPLDYQQTTPVDVLSISSRQSEATQALTGEIVTRRKSSKLDLGLTVADLSDIIYRGNDDYE